MAKPPLSSSAGIFQFSSPTFRRLPPKRARHCLSDSRFLFVSLEPFPPGTRSPELKSFFLFWTHGPPPSLSSLCAVNGSFHERNPALYIISPFRRILPALGVFGTTMFPPSSRGSFRSPLQIGGGRGTLVLPRLGAPVNSSSLLPSHRPPPYSSSRTPSFLIKNTVHALCLWPAPSLSRSSPELHLRPFFPAIIVRASFLFS